MQPSSCCSTDQKCPKSRFDIFFDFVTSAVDIIWVFFVWWADSASEVYEDVITSVFVRHV